jgi:hypothetical protein
VGVGAWRPRRHRRRGPGRHLRLSLDRLVFQAGGPGPKVLLVGDWTQLGAVEAGGAFGMLVSDRQARSSSSRHAAPPSLGAEGERPLRSGNPEAVDAYPRRDRVVAGDEAEVLSARQEAGAADVADRNPPPSGHLPEKSAGSPALDSKVRAVQGTGPGDSPPGPQPHQSRKAHRPARLGGAHAEETLTLRKRRCGLPPLPRRHS